MINITIEAQRLLEKWQTCKSLRYPVLVVAPIHPTFISENNLLEIPDFIGAELLDFEDRYRGQLNRFIPWYVIRDEILKEAIEKTVIVIHTEFFYDKWTGEERTTFLRNLLRQDGHKGVILGIYCQDNLHPIVDNISSKDRGMIWNP